MMKISAVICEINPLHDGHRYLFSRAKSESDVVIAVMSGNYVQRGECAVYDKYKRAKDTVFAGADLCVELPFPFSSSSAEYFARAGVHIAESMGADKLIFGSECGDTETLRRAAEILNDRPVKNGIAAARAREEYLRENFPDAPESIFSSPNDILGVEYCRRASIDTMAVKRTEAESATLIRQRLYEKDPGCVGLKKLTEAEFLHFRALRTPPNDAECQGGVGGRLYNAAFSVNDPEEWLISASTKRYTNSRLRRAALFALFGVKAEELSGVPEFTRLLAANEKGREYLSSLRGYLKFPVVTNPSDRYALRGEALDGYLMSERADKFYTLLSGEKDPAAFSKMHPGIM